MIQQRKRRKCSLCGEVATAMRCFPSNAKLAHQRLWIRALGLDDDSSTRELTSIRYRISRNEDVRWCDKHFGQDGLPRQTLAPPVDNSAAVAVDEKRPRIEQPEEAGEPEGGETVEGTEARENTGEDEGGFDVGLDDPLIPPIDALENDRREHDTRNDAIDPMIHVFRERQLGGPLSLSQLALDPPPRAHDHALPVMGDVEILRYDSVLSSAPTLGRQDSSFRISQLSQPTESEGEEEEEDDSVSSDYFIIAKSELDNLFRRCQECGALIDQTSLSRTQVASAYSVSYQCTGCKGMFRWNSQKKKGRGRSAVFEMNQSIPIAAFITGTPIPRLIDLFKLLRVAISSDRAMRDAIRFFGCPAIDRVHSRWQEDARALSKEVAPEDGITVALDGQYDSPGHCATNGKVTVFDSHLDLVLSAVSLSVHDPAIGGVSCRIESVGSERALVELVDAGFHIRVTDSNAMVDKRLRENPKLEHIEAKRDFWHVQKPLRKQWWTAMKRADCSLLSQWYKSFFNHLYYINERFPQKEDRPLALEYVRSFLKHCTGTHKWKKDDEFPLTTKCLHPVKKGKKGKRKGVKGEEPQKTPKDSITIGSPEFDLLHSLLFSRAFEKSFLACSPEAGTAVCENYHSVALMYAPKRLSCSPAYYNRKMKLGVLHHNSNTYGKMIGERVEIGDVQLPRRGRVALCVKRKMTPGDHPWREEILDECWTLRDEYEDKRFLKRIGAPEDDHFDELRVIYDRIVRREEGVEDEEEGGEENWESDISEEMNGPYRP